MAASRAAPRTVRLGTKTRANEIEGVRGCSGRDASQGTCRQSPSSVHLALNSDDHLFHRRKTGR